MVSPIASKQEGGAVTGVWSFEQGKQIGILRGNCDEMGGFGYIAGPGWSSVCSHFAGVHWITVWPLVAGFAEWAMNGFCFACEIEAVV